jgi:hypothetical protein
MLVAMTYQGELFICVILGLAAGHAFNLHLAPEGQASPAGSEGKRGGWSDAAGEGNDGVALKQFGHSSKDAAIGGGAAAAVATATAMRQLNEEDECQKLEPCCCSA